MVQQLGAIAVGGAIGAILRHVVFLWTSNTNFPWGTVTVNLVGCFVIGLFFQLFEHVTLSSEQRAFLFTGLLGAFTTFSTYGLDVVKLVQADRVETAVFKILISNGAGIGLVFLGIRVARWLLRLAR